MTRWDLFFVVVAIAAWVSAFVLAMVGKIRRRRARTLAREQMKSYDAAKEIDESIRQARFREQSVAPGKGQENLVINGNVRYYKGQSAKLGDQGTVVDSGTLSFAIKDVTVQNIEDAKKFKKFTDLMTNRVGLISAVSSVSFLPFSYQAGSYQDGLSVTQPTKEQPPPPKPEEIKIIPLQTKRKLVLR